MSKFEYKDRVKESTATTGTGTITLGGARTSYQSYSSAYGADAAVVNLIRDGNAWEISTGTYSNAGGTVTRTLIASSTGSLLNLSGSATIGVDWDAHRALLTQRESRAHIEGLELDYNAGTLKCLRGFAEINGSLLEVGSAGITTISGDALSGAAIYYIYLYDNSGTIQMHRESRGSGADDPVWDYDLDYAKHPVDGAAKRCIGAIYIGQTTSGVMDEFVFVSTGRLRNYFPKKSIARVLSAGSAITATSVDCSASVPAVSICKQVGFTLHVKNATLGATDVVFVIWAQTSAGATAYGGLQVSAEMDTASKAAALGPLLLDINGTTFYYLVDDSNTDGFCDVMQWRMWV